MGRLHSVCRVRLKGAPGLGGTKMLSMRPPAPPSGTLTRWNGTWATAIGATVEASKVTDRQCATERNCRIPMRSSGMTSYLSRREQNIPRPLRKDRLSCDLLGLGMFGACLPSPFTTRGVPSNLDWRRQVVVDAQPAASPRPNPGRMNRMPTMTRRTLLRKSALAASAATLATASLSIKPQPKNQREAFSASSRFSGSRRRPVLKKKRRRRISLRSRAKFRGCLRRMLGRTSRRAARATRSAE